MQIMRQAMKVRVWVYVCVQVCVCVCVRAYYMSVMCGLCSLLFFAGEMLRVCVCVSQRLNSACSWRTYDVPCLATSIKKAIYKTKFIGRNGSSGSLLMKLTHP